MPGRSPRRKGDRIERQIVALHTDMGVKAERVPLSGAAGGSFSGDVDIYACGSDAAPMVGEVKARAGGQGFIVLEKWLADNDILFLRRDRVTEPLVVLPWRSWARLLAGAQP